MPRFYKLREVFDRFAFLRELKPESKAIDLGAAPGGWTKVIIYEIVLDILSQNVKPIQSPLE
jgi:23S rRNA U2552 (ribose-2'-O)-methylase RlmE/FtsJ